MPLSKIPSLLPASSSIKLTHFLSVYLPVSFFSLERRKHTLKVFVNNYHINKFHDKLSFRLQRQNCIERSLLGNAFAYILIMRRHGNSILFRLTWKMLSALWKGFLVSFLRYFSLAFFVRENYGLKRMLFFAHVNSF